VKNVALFCGAIIAAVSACAILCAILIAAAEVHYIYFDRHNLPDLGPFTRFADRIEELQRAGPNDNMYNQELVEAIMTDDGGPAQAGDGHAVATQRSERTESEWSQPRISS
jgi:hypothetical protein